MMVAEQLPADLLNVLDSCEFDDEAGILIEKVTYSLDGLRLLFSLNYEDDFLPQQLWQLKVDAVEDECIKREWTKQIALYKSHPLLLEYTDIQSELYFNGATDKPNELFLDIFNAIVESKYSVKHHSYIFSPKSIKDFCEQRFGLFARGPITILKIYQQCLSKYGIKSNLLGDYDPEQSEELKLFKLGNAYIIGKGFAFERQV